MSAEPAPRPHQARTAAARPTSLRPVLRALPQRVRQQQMGRLGFAILIVVMLAAGLAGLLVLNTTIQAQSMQIARRRAISTSCNTSRLFWLLRSITFVVRRTSRNRPRSSA